ncbi:MAG: hypothetical protein A2145_01375 [candidate division Zixibacteria bacterium RBG_16_40_9]|nr:MAG: hypothetical protein A2145_01375 [candidate division Zixibacteria bacterium RBG_16_40_9]
MKAQRSNKMYISWIILGVMVLFLTYFALRKGGTILVGESFAAGGNLFLKVLPNLLFGFAIAGFLQMLLPSELIAKWIGKESGNKGLLIGMIAGSLTPGGPFLHFPILASFLSKGAGVGPITAYIAAWSLIGLNRFFVWEMPILGSPIALVRFFSSFVFPFIIGWIAGWVYDKIIT